ncbi:hypothetical protein QNO07_09575 [Streptomyces sp. 549]|uniref:hypothetical protein n=1 Tax=Streptomyces sp. 549 TaxID=3049076 RepID=UPI0024C28F6A|nr:hypothetical protein [Streptomyces sp. 549]MDK1473669.1 hypothetical protein [Streptomyces sp. 549]
MTLDAMDWVWKHSQSKGNARLVLLYVADQVRTAACEVRIGQREISRVALNSASKGTAEAAVKKALELGELEIAEPAKGRRSPLYRLPKAVDYVRTASSSAPDSGAQESGSAPVLRAQEGSGSAPEFGAQAEVCAPNFDPLRPENRGTSPIPNKASRPDGQSDAGALCHQLMAAMTEAGITVSWGMKSEDWIETAHLIRKCGIPAMVDFARAAKARAKQPPMYATFFLRGGWRGLPPAFSTPPPLPGPRRDEKPPHCGHLDCDPESRYRAIERGGLRALTPCPECHPDTQGATA